MDEFSGRLGLDLPGDCPNESGHLTSYCRVGDDGPLASLRQRTMSAAKSGLRLPRDVNDRLRQFVDHVLLRHTDAGRVLVRPGTFDRHGACRAIPGLTIHREVPSLL